MIAAVHPKFIEQLKGRGYKLEVKRNITSGNASLRGQLTPGKIVTPKTFSTKSRYMKYKIQETKKKIKKKKKIQKIQKQ